MKKIVLVVIIFGILASVFYYFYSRNGVGNESNAVRQAHLEETLGHKIVTPNPNGNAATEYSGKYISFSYPADSSIVPKDTISPGSSTLEVFEFTMDNPRISMGITVNKIANLASLDEFSGVSIRENQAGTYTKTQVKLDDSKGIGFTKNDASGYEKTAFFFDKWESLYICCKRNRGRGDK